MEIITGNQSLGDNLTLMKRSKKIYKLEEKSNEDLFWNGVFFNHLEKIELMLKVKNMINLPIFKNFLLIEI